ncbi:MAG: hypothetical protein ABEI11_02765 [Haloarculaceae archaeon]
MRRTVLAVALSVLCLTAGCSFGGAGTATETGSPTPTPGLSAAETPPGVSDGRLADEAALLSAHTDRLAATGAVWDVETNATVYRAGASSRVERKQRTFVEPGSREYVYQLANPRSRFTAWGNRSLQVIRGQVGERERFRIADAADNRSLVGARLLAPQLNEGELAVASINRSADPTRVTLRTTTPPEEARAFPRNATNVTGYTAVLVVDATGRIHSFEASATYDVRAGGETVVEGASYEISYRLVDRDAPRVQRPGWVNRTLVNASTAG